MERRDFVKKAGLGVAAGTLVAGCSSETADSGAPNVQTQPRIRWRLASSFPPNLDTIFGAADVLSRRVRQLTDERFEIRTYAGGELVPAFEVLGAVQSGTVQMGHSASYYFQGKNPALIFDCTIPFGLTARQHNAWIYHGGGMDLLRELFADFNVRNLPGGNTGMQMGGWFRQPIGSLEGLQGLRMRIPGLGGSVMSKMGVNVQNISGGEIYSALERGAIDATEWVGPYDDEKLGFHEVAKNYYYPGWWEPGPALSFYVNQNAWDQLPSDYQHALETASAEANVKMLASYDAKNPQALRRLLDSGVNLRRFPEDVMQRAREVTRELLVDQSSGDLYDRLYQAYRDWQETSELWFGSVEHAYGDFVYDDVQQAL